MSFPRYPKYKDSGVEWLGEVPEHWIVKPLRGLAREERTAFIDGDWIEAPYITDVGVRLIQTGNIGVGFYKEQGFRFVSEETFEKLACTEIAPGDILICRLADPVGRACIAPNLESRMITSVDVCIMKTRDDVLASFVVYVLSSAHYLGFMEGQCRGGTRDRVSRSFLGTVRVSLPSFAEQQAIAAFLDRETAKIDALIAEQQRLIELLKEKRQAVISHTVTKGLNPYAPMKDSGIEWLGEVPAHWQLKRLKHLSPFITVGVVVNPSTFVADEGLPFIYGGDIREGVIDWQNSRRIGVEASEENSKTKLKAGDLLTVRVGAPGVTAVVPPECDGGNCASVMLIRQGRFSSQWLSYVMNTRIVRFQVEVVQYGAAQEQFNISHAINFCIPTPPCKEQEQLAEFLRAETSRFDALTTEAQRAIDLLQERRTALISSAVTGQIDVRQLN